VLQVEARGIVEQKQEQEGYLSTLIQLKSLIELDM
jgi:hypothetical protein